MSTGPAALRAKLDNRLRAESASRKIDINHALVRGFWEQWLLAADTAE
ncbi:hypothetical protein N8J89_37610 [Crossiella sp. CA-258035]|nr:hypothetical protein [Crossiella sp. CA-258035]WHT18762.1 hypothetical protein N8J89_37610 [Crossiella sp. CA-258035]